jgi:hypothetical protein
MDLSKGLGGCEHTKKTQTYALNRNIQKNPEKKTLSIDEKRSPGGKTKGQIQSQETKRNRINQT